MKVESKTRMKRKLFYTTGITVPSKELSCVVNIKRNMNINESGVKAEV